MTERKKLPNYPAKPTVKGYARVSYSGREFYFDEHNTRESWVLFSEWRKVLDETGEAPEVKPIRERLEAERVLRLDQAHEHAIESAAKDLLHQQSVLKEELTTRLDAAVSEVLRRCAEAEAARSNSVKRYELRRAIALACTLLYLRGPFPPCPVGATNNLVRMQAGGPIQGQPAPGKGWRFYYNSGEFIINYNAATACHPSVTYDEL